MKWQLLLPLLIMTGKLSIGYQRILAFAVLLLLLHKTRIAAAREIDRVGSHPQMVQVGLSIHSPYGGWGDKRYHPIWEAAQEMVLSVRSMFLYQADYLDLDRCYGNYYPEDQTNNGLTYQAQITSIVFGGVFEKYPELRMVFVEGGFAWLPNVMYTMDTHWRNLKTRSPLGETSTKSAVREHMWFGTQPFIEPARHEDEQHIVQIIKMIGTNQILFASDYPHWEFDAPHAAFARVPTDIQKKIFYQNAVELYGLPNPMDQKTIRL